MATLKADKNRTEDLVERLNRHPEFRDKVEELLDIADNKSGDANKADDAEDLIWEELREMGQRISRTGRSESMIAWLERAKIERN